MYFQLYAHNVPVRGRAASAVYDLHRGAITRIPNVLFDIVQELVGTPLATVRHRYAYDLPSFDRYLQFLHDKDLGFESAEPACFPPTTFAWRHPGPLTHSVLEHELEQHYALPPVLAQLEALLCRHLELRLDLAGQPAAALELLLASLAESSFKAITLFLRHSGATPPAWLDTLFGAHPKLAYVFCHSAPATVRCSQYQRVITTRWQLRPDDAPAALPPPRYVVNPTYFAEARHHNPYYNGKVCVDRLGQVKNCLRHTRSFGQVQTQPLRTLIEQADFQQLWYASVDKIDGLCESELRYATSFVHNLHRVGPERYQVVTATVS